MKGLGTATSRILALALLSLTACFDAELSWDGVEESTDDYLTEPFLPRTFQNQSPDAVNASNFASFTFLGGCSELGKSVEVFVDEMAVPTLLGTASCDEFGYLWSYNTQYFFNKADGIYFITLKETSSDGLFNTISLTLVKDTSIGFPTSMTGPSQAVVVNFAAQLEMPFTFDCPEDGRIHWQGSAIGHNLCYDSSGVQTIYVDATSAADGPLTFDFYFEDVAGNVTSTPVFNWAGTKDATPPQAPVFVSFIPTSPSSSTYPYVRGTSSSIDSNIVFLYTDSSCTNMMNTGSPSIFASTGIGLPVTSNTTTPIYARVNDVAGNWTACTLMATFTSDLTPPIAPTMVNDGTGSPLGTSPLITWASSTDTLSGVAYYELGIGTSTSFPNVVPFTSVGLVNSHQFTSITLSAGIPYYGIVRAIDYAGNASAYSAGDGWIAGPPISPTALSLAPSTHTSLYINWADNSSNETGFRIQRALDAAFTVGLTEFTTSSNTTAYQATGLTLGTTYYFRVAAENAGGVSSYTGYMALAPGLNLVTPFEMIDTPIGSHDTGSNSFERSITKVDYNDFDGIQDWWWEVVATNTDSVPRTIDLVNDINPAQVIASITLSSGISVPQRITSATFNPISFGVYRYRVRMPQTTAWNDAIVYTSRIIVKQQGAHRTAVSFPLTSGNMDTTSNHYSTPYDLNTASAYESTTAPSVSPHNTSLPFRKTPTAWSTLNGTTPWEFHAVIGYCGGAAYAQLFNLGGNSAIPGTEVGPSVSGVPDLFISPLSDSASGFGASDLIQARVRSDGSGNGCLYSARLYQRLENISRVRIPVRVGNFASVAAGSQRDLVQSRAIYVGSTELSPHTVRMVGYLFRPAAGTGSFSVALRDCGMNDSGSSCSPVSGSTLSTAASGYVFPTSSALSLTGGNRYIVTGSAASGISGLSTAVSGALLIDVAP